MSVDFLTCENCGENFCDCGDYVSCDCCRVWCCEECAEDDGYRRDSCKKNEEFEIIEGHCQDDEDCEKGYNEGCEGCENYIKGGCNYCRHEDYDDYTLLELAMELLKCNRKFLINKMKERED